MPTAYHMVHYRRFKLSDNTAGSTLEDLCRTALDVTNSNGIKLWERAQDRLCSLNDPEGREIFLNRVADLSSAVFGEMCLTQAQDLQALLQMHAKTVQLSNLTLAEVFELNERTAPSGSKFIRGMLYWLAIGNHLFFIKTQSMTANFLSTYIKWLIGSVTSSNDFLLQAEFDKSQVGGDIGDIRSLRVSGKNSPQFAVVPSDALPRTTSVTKTVADKVVQFSQAIPIIQAILGKAGTQSLIESLGPEEYLAVDAAVKIRGKRTTNSRETISKLADDLADLTDGEVKVEGQDGTISGGDAILRTRMPFDLPHEGSHLLDFNNVADQLQEVYKRFVSDGKIDA